MKNFLKKLGTEWEKTLFTCILLLILAYLGFIAYNMLMDDGGSSSDTAKPKDPHTYFDTHSFAYLSSPGLQKEVNPLLFHIKINMPPPPKPPTPSANNNNNQQPPKPNTEPKQPPKTNTGGNKPTPPPPQQNQGGGKPQPPTPPPPPPPPPRKIMVQYRGFVSGSETKLAFYSANDSQSKKTEAKSAQPGAKIHGVLEIKGFDATTITLSQNGKDIVVKKGKKQEIIIQ